MSRLNPGRLLAANALLAVDQGGRADDVLTDSALQGQDRRFAYHVTLGVLRARGRLDQALRPHLNRRMGKLDPGIRVTLRLGAFELLCMRTPRHAAVNQAVELSKRLRLGRAGGFVNAVLRKVDTLSDDVLLDHPEWLIKRWTERWGRDAVRAWCERLSTPAPLTVALRQDLDVGEPATWEGQVVPRCQHAPGAQPTEIEGWDQGHLWVMDAAAAGVADCVQALEGERVLDACAAPGGKTLRLAATGALVTATDRSEGRLSRLHENLARVGLPATVQIHDWEQGCPADWVDRFDAALVDAPCTALGTTRRHPDIRWSRSATDPMAMSLIQREILRGAAQSVRPGGRLVYAVCSPEPEEGVAVARRFVKKTPGWTLDQEWGLEPPTSDHDAFYAARLVRA